MQTFHHIHFSWYQIILVAFVALFLIQIIRRITRKKNNEEQKILDDMHNDPANWKFGVFYFNKNDRRLFPPKRISSMGWTVNFANLLSILAMFVLIVIIIIVSNAFL